jgi:hypothetical protein
MTESRGKNTLACALYLNAALLAAILVVLLSRGNGMPSVISAAWAQDRPPQAALNPQPIAGGGGLFLMPCQFSQSSWGCYIMDIDMQTVCAYQFNGVDHTLKLMAARNFKNDRRLSNFNTTPAPSEVGEWVKKEQEQVRGLNAQNENPATPSPEAPKSE